MLWLYLLAAAVLVALNGVFVAAEFAIVRVRTARLAAAEGENADLAAEQTKRLDLYLSACQLGITMASIGLGFVGEPAIAPIFEHLFEDAGLGTSAAVIVGTIAAFTIVTIFHVVLGEQAPKAVAISRPEPTVSLLSRPMALFMFLFRPPVVALNAMANGVIRIFGVEPPSEQEPATPRDFREMIKESEDHGALSHDQAEMLIGVFDLTEREAREVMTPRPDMSTTTPDATVRDVASLAAQVGHSRIPLVDGTDVAGLVHVSDIADEALETPDMPAAQLAREAYIVPETKRLDHLLRELRNRRASMALVADEYGDIAGLVTLEDILEEIVGEIFDETDREAGSVLRELADGVWSTTGRTALNDLADAGLAIDTERSYSTVGGLVQDGLGRIARRGDRVDDSGYQWLVEDARGTRIVRVRITRSSAESNGATAG